MIEAEQALIGSILRNSKIFDDVLEVVTSDDFQSKQHQAIFDKFTELQENNSPIDLVTAGNPLGNQQLAYLGELLHNTISAANFKTHAKMVKQAATERRLRAAVFEIDQLLNDSAISTDDKLEQATALINPIVEKSQIGEGAVKLKQIMVKVVENIDHRFNGGTTGIMTGHVDVDKRLNGLQPSDLILVAGRPSMGKTVFATNTAFNVARSGIPVQIFSLEMSSDQITEREMCATSGIDYGNIRSGKLSDDEWHMLTMATGQMADLPVYIDDTPSLHINQIRARARIGKRKYGTGLIVIDYMQLISATGQNRENEISSISRSLKAMAKELNIPVIALSQLNRNLESRPNKRPRNSDLRESGSLEQDADVIMFIYRDEVYNADTQDKGIAEIITSKFRNGAIGTDHMTFQGKHQRFRDFIGEYEHKEPIGKKWKGGFDAGGLD